VLEGCVKLLLLQGFCPDSVQAGYDRDINKDTTFRLMCMVKFLVFKVGFIMRFLEVAV
jgi:hypothetical protein